MLSIHLGDRKFFTILFYENFRWSERVSEITTHSMTDRKVKEIADRLLSIDYNAEILWLR